MEEVSANLSPRRLWFSVGALALAELVSWGVLVYAFGVLLPAMERDLGAGRTLLSAVFSAGLLVASLLAAPVGRWLDRRGARAVMTAGAALAALLVVAWAHVRSLPELAAVWLGLGLAQALVLYEPAFAGVTAWFPDMRRRSWALLVVTLCGALASAVFVPLTGQLLASRGWRETLLVLAGLAAVVTIPAHAALPGSGQPSAPAPDLAAGVPESDAGFGWVVAAYAMQGVIYGAMLVHAVPLLTEAGHPPVRAAALAGLFGIFQFAGRLLSTSWGGRRPACGWIPGLLATQLAAMGALLFARHEAAVWVYAVCFGAGNGMLTLLRPLVVAEWHGAARFGVHSGRLAGWMHAARALAPLLAGGLHDWSGGYAGVIAALALCSLGGMLAAARAVRLKPGGVPA